MGVVFERVGRSKLQVRFLQAKLYLKNRSLPYATSGPWTRLNFENFEVYTLNSSRQG